MNPNQTTNPLSDSQQPPTPVSEWFAGQAAPPAPTPPPKRSFKRIVIIIVAAVLALSGVAVAIFLPRLSSSPVASSDPSTSCFNAHNYDDFLALVRTVDDDTISSDDVKPQKLLYTHYVKFVPGSASIDSDASEGTAAFLQALGQYGKTKQSTAPIVIHIDANYLSTSSVTLVRQQMTKVYQTLVDAGFNKDHIVTNEPTLVLQSDDIDFEENDTVIVSMAPSVNCDTQSSQ